MAQSTVTAENPTPRRNRNLYPKAGAWIMFGLRLLFCLPVIGFITAIVFSFVPVNPNLKSLARSELLMQALFTLVFLLLFSLFMSFVYPVIQSAARTLSAVSGAMEQLDGLDPEILQSAAAYGIDLSALEGLGELAPLLEGFGG